MQWWWFGGVCIIAKGASNLFYILIFVLKLPIRIAWFIAGNFLPYLSLPVPWLGLCGLFSLLAWWWQNAAKVQTLPGFVKGHKFWLSSLFLMDDLNLLEPTSFSNLNPVQGRYRARTGFSLLSFPHREKPVFITGISLWENFTGKTLFSLQGICLQCCYSKMSHIAVLQPWS